MRVDVRVEGCLLAAITSGYGFAAGLRAPARAMPDGAPRRGPDARPQAQVAYQAAMTEFPCLHRPESSAASKRPTSSRRSRHNAAVAEMEGVAAAFNDQLRAFRAANPAPAAN
jgi:hypothetical protein